MSSGYKVGPQSVFSIPALPPSPPMANSTSVSFMACLSQSLCSVFPTLFGSSGWPCDPVLVSEMDGASFGGGGSEKAFVFPFGHSVILSPGILEYSQDGQSHSEHLVTTLLTPPGKEQEDLPQRG